MYNMPRREQQAEGLTSVLVSASVHEHMHADEFRKGVDLRLNGVSSTLKFLIQIKVMSSLLALAANHLQTIQ